MVKNLNISEEVINKFLNGKDQQEGIIAIECTYNDEDVSIVYKNKETNEKRLKKEPFYPFLWAKSSGAKRLCQNKDNHRQDREKLRKLMEKEHISIKKLNIHNENGNTSERLENGYTLLFTAKKKMSYSKFIQFFRNCGVDLYDGTRDFLTVNPVEQYMIQSGKRFFKGYDDYDELLRLQFDFETQGLNPIVHRITQVGIRTNRGFCELIQVTGNTEEEKNKSELELIDTMLRIMSGLKPDVITGQNSENFDWNFAFIRLEQLGTSITEISKKYFKLPIYKSKKPTVLKLGGEVEYFHKTNIWGFNVTDSLHAIRRAQAIDSNMKKADLKYVTKYSKLNKPNRVYVPGDKIEATYQDTNNKYAFNDLNGLWYMIDDEHPLKDEYTVKTGKYIVERYLEDDLYETDKVELRYNQPNFLLGKIIPTSFSRVCTMGTAAIWKLIMMTWSYENNLAIPNFSEPKRFTGGLSRLLKVGYVANCVKLDYNSLYPSIILTWMIESGHDISHAMLSLLSYILDQRELFKGLKGEAKKQSKKLKELLENNEEIKNSITEYKRINLEIKKLTDEEYSNDKKQLPLKITANSFFGSYGSPNLFPWGDVSCAEKTTCIGRQCLRLMVKWFSQRGYTPIVGDSFTSDTPVYIKYNDTDYIDIKPICEIFNSQKSNIDYLGREYDTSYKDYKILCRSGWVEPTYIYRHKTNKNIHRIFDDKMLVDVTSDHSLFDENKKKIHSKEINKNTNLEYYIGEIKTKNEIVKLDKKTIIKYAKQLINNEIDRIPIEILNANRIIKNIFIREINKNNITIETHTKTCVAGVIFLKNSI